LALHLVQGGYENREALWLVGSIEISDYLDLIVRGEDLSRFLSGLIDFLARSGSFEGLPFDWYNWLILLPRLQRSKRNLKNAAGPIVKKYIAPHAHRFEWRFRGLSVRHRKKQRHENPSQAAAGCGKRSPCTFLYRGRCRHIDSE